MKQKNLHQVKQRRVFSEEIRRQVVRDFEENRCTVLQASRELNVCSKTIYEWIGKYNRYLNNNKTLVVQDKSEAYRTQELQKRIKELEAALGRQALENEYLKTLLEVASKELDIDLKKNFATKLLTNSKRKKGLE